MYSPRLVVFCAFLGLVKSDVVCSSDEDIVRCLGADISDSTRITGIGAKIIIFSSTRVRNIRVFSLCAWTGLETVIFNANHELDCSSTVHLTNCGIEVRGQCQSSTRNPLTTFPADHTTSPIDASTTPNRRTTSRYPEYEYTTSSPAHNTPLPRPSSVTSTADSPTELTSTRFMTEQTSYRRIMQCGEICRCARNTVRCHGHALDDRSEWASGLTAVTTLLHLTDTRIVHAIGMWKLCEWPKLETLILADNAYINCTGITALADCAIAVYGQCGQFPSTASPETTSPATTTTTTPPPHGPA